jgi:hypothetical protein
MHFTRTLQKRVTKTGAHYVLSIPGEVAQDLQLEAGGLCSLEVMAESKGKVEVILTPYQDAPVYIRHFSNEGLDVDDEPVMTAIPLEEPITRGRSQPVTTQQFKPFLAASKLLFKYIEAGLNTMKSTESGRAALENAFRRRGF